MGGLGVGGLWGVGGFLVPGVRATRADTRKGFGSVSALPLSAACYGGGFRWQSLGVGGGVALILVARAERPHTQGFFGVCDHLASERCFAGQTVGRGAGAGPAGKTPKPRQDCPPAGRPAGALRLSALCAVCRAAAPLGRAAEPLVPNSFR